MKDNELLQLLNESDFHLDSFGRVVIDNPEVLNAINGAMGDTSSNIEVLHNGACANAGCK